MQDDRKRSWADYCRSMAEMSYALAEWCEDAEMSAGYIALAAKWVNLGLEGPPDGQAAALAGMEPANRLVA